MLDRCLAINVRGTFLCYKYASEQMIRQGRGGRIIGASSLAGKRGSHSLIIDKHLVKRNCVWIGQGMLAAYSASKFAIRGLTQATGVSCE